MKAKWFLSLLIIFDIACSSTHKCEPFFVYKSNQINIKGISTKLRKNGEVVKEKTIGSIFIDPKYVEASDELKRLDLYQTRLCEQLDLIKDDSVKNERRSEYVLTLMDMMKIAQRPDSMLSSRVVRLETAEEKRTNEEKYLTNLKSTPPNVDFNLSINKDGTMLYKINFLNDVPIYYRTELYRFDNGARSGPITIGQWPQLSPKRQRQYNLPAHTNVNDPNLSKVDTFKVKAYFKYISIYYDEVNIAGMSKEVTKIYFIDRSKSMCQLVEEYYK